MKAKLNIIKIGGNIIDDESALHSFIETVAQLNEPCILIHGGGKLATRMAEAMQVPQVMVEGRRITDAETLKIVTMVYAGYINKNIVANLQKYSVNAIGLCGADANVIMAHKRIHASIDYGFAGDVDHVNASFISLLIQQGLTIVLAPITHDAAGQLLNTNADTIASEVAKAMGKEFEVMLCYLFEKKGVLSDISNESSVISQIDTENYQALKMSKAIHSGMIPKLDNAFAALSEGVHKVVIADAADLLLALKGQAGTTIVL